MLRNEKAWITWLRNASRFLSSLFRRAPPCVPATPFGDSPVGEIKCSRYRAASWAGPEILLQKCMNCQVTWYQDPVVMCKKSKSLRSMQNRSMGIAPAYRRACLKNIVEAGQSTDHECLLWIKPLAKSSLAINIAIREGSAAINFEAPNSTWSEWISWIILIFARMIKPILISSTISISIELAARAVAKEKIFLMYQAACLIRFSHYSTSSRSLRESDPADFILVRDLKKFRGCSTYIKWWKVQNGKPWLSESYDIIKMFKLLPEITERLFR